MENYVGEKLGNYRLTHLLGVGGYAAVYLAEHMYLKTQAAIKVLRISLDAEVLDRFLAEARTIAHLEHPNIVRTLEFGVQDNIAYLVMSYAPNGTVLRRYPRGSIVPLHIVVQYVRQIADALQYAHAHNVIHRDVKPENMLLGRDEEILLSDFGLAVMSASSPSWKPVDRAGTIGYMAPEQIEGKPSKSSDQYGLGVVVYEWLCGRLPFTGLDKEIAARQLQGAPPPLSELAPSVPEAMAQVVMKALAKDPSERFLSVLHFAQALEEAYQPYKLVRLLPTDRKMHHASSRDLSLKSELSAIVEAQPPSSILQSSAVPGDSRGERSTKLALKGSAKHTVPVPWPLPLWRISIRLTLAVLAALTTISLVSAGAFWFLHNPSPLASSAPGLSRAAQPSRTAQASSGKMRASVVGVRTLPPVPSGQARPTPTPYVRSTMDTTTNSSSAYTAMSTPQATPTTSGTYSPSAYTYTVSTASTPAPVLAPTPKPVALTPTPTPVPVLQPTPPGKGRLTAPGQLKKNQG